MGKEAFETLQNYWRFLHLLINHFIILYNVFGEAATPLLFFKIDKDLWLLLKHLWFILEDFQTIPRLHCMIFQWMITVYSLKEL